MTRTEGTAPTSPLRRRPTFAATLAAGVLIAGCGDPGNRSPNALDDPERAARAREQTVAVEGANREAEAAFYRSLRLASEPDAEPGPDAGEASRDD